MSDKYGAYVSAKASPIPREKMICEKATIHMLMSHKRFQLGLIRASIPILAPGSVNAKITMIAIMINMAGIKIFEASPIPLSIDLWEI